MSDHTLQPSERLPFREWRLCVCSIVMEITWYLAHRNSG